MSKMLVGSLLAGWLLAGQVVLAEPLRVLYINKSEGFEHSPVHQENGAPSYSDNILRKLIEEMGGALTSSKDAALVNAENLKNYDVVIFYTQGDLTKMGEKDQGQPMPATGVQELLDWVKGGGGFMALHAGTDSFRSGVDGEPTPYTQMVGGEFRTHGPQFKGTLRIVDTAHPIVAGVPAEWEVMEEWYLHRNFNTASMHVLAVLDPGKAIKLVPGYDLPTIPMLWCSTYGQGRVFVNGMGHREDVWDHENYQKTLVNGLKWLNGEGEALVEPNFEKVVVPELDPTTGARKK